MISSGMTDGEEMMFLAHRTTRKDFKSYLGYSDNYYVDILKQYYIDAVGKDRCNLDADTQQHIKAVVEWFSSPKWGLILMGGVGNGKTSMLKALFKYADKQVSKKESMYLCGYFVSYDIATAAAQDYRYFEKMKMHDILGIDDMGEEPVEVTNYGNVICPITRILEERYAKQKVTIISTNLDAEAIKKKYGMRVADRLREMCDIIPYVNPSYRK